MAALSSCLKSMGKKIDIYEVMEIQYLLKSTLSGELPDYIFIIIQSSKLLKQYPQHKLTCDAYSYGTSK